MCGGDGLYCFVFSLIPGLLSSSIRLITFVTLQGFGRNIAIYVMLFL